MFRAKTELIGQGQENPPESFDGIGSYEDEDDDVGVEPGIRITNHAKKFYICDSKLHEKILELLSLKDLLTCRLVCQNWYKIIGDSGLLWRRACLKFSQCRLGLRLQSSDMRGYGNSDLIKHFRCPNYSFYHSDLRDDLHRNFFIIHGLKVKFIRIANCYITKSTFDLIILRCPNLEHFEVNCITRSISLCESLFTPSDGGIGSSSGFLLKLPKLESIVLKRMDSNIKSDGNRSYDYGFRTQSHDLKIMKKDKKHGFLPEMENFDGENLSSLFLQQLLDSCKYLRRIHLSGWHQATAYNLINIVNGQSEFFNSLKEIELDRIVGPIDDSLFFPLCSEPCGIQLKKLTISLKEPPRVTDNDEFVEQQEKGENGYMRNSLDALFQKALELHSDTLEELNLNNLPITGYIFQTKFPKLYRLSLKSTWVEVEDIKRLVNHMPKLEVMDHSLSYNYPSENVASPQRTNDKKFKFCFSPKFHQCSSFDNICMISFGSMLSILMTILLISQFETYGQWFICLGLILLSVICTADFLQYHCGHNGHN